MFEVSSSSWVGIVDFWGGNINFLPPAWVQNFHLALGLQIGQTHCLEGEGTTFTVRIPLKYVV